MVFKFLLYNNVTVSQYLFSDNEDGLIWPKHTSSQTSETSELTFIRQTHQILLNPHLTNAPNHRPFKCPAHSCRSLEL